MAELTEYLQRLRHAQPSAGMDVSVEMLNHFPELNPSIVENFSVNDFSVEYSSLAHQQTEFPATYYHNNLASCFYPDILSTAPVVHTVTLDPHDFHESKKRKVKQQSTSGSMNIFPTASANNTKKKNINLGRRKKGKNKKDREVDKAEEVIHVRAKRGQATDSHSIAERVRREKINNKLRCLQDLVPGCKKSMGMAVTLEEIINYVHSLQNQVEFLSMELAAASCPYDLTNNVTEPSKKAQETNSAAAQEMQKWLREKHGGNTSFHSTWSV